MPDTMMQEKGDKNVTVRTGGNEKQQCSVMLCITANGRKLLPYIVFKRKTLPKVNVKGVIIQAQESGLMDQALVLNCINHMWQKCPGALLNLRSMLILDSFHGHTTEEVKKILNSRNTDQVIIHGGLILMLQPLDVCIKWLFKAALKEQYTRWITAREHEFMPMGKSCHQMLSSFVSGLEVWARILPTLIQKSFKKCGISNKLDGTEDDYGTVIPTTRAQWKTMTTKAVEKNSCK
jgi:hypothetical protein